MKCCPFGSLCILYRWIVETQGERLFDDALIARVVLQGTPLLPRQDRFRVDGNGLLPPLVSRLFVSMEMDGDLNTSEDFTSKFKGWLHLRSDFCFLNPLANWTQAPPQDITQSLFASSETFHFREGIVFDLFTVYDTLLVAPCFLVSLSPPPL